MLGKPDAALGVIQPMLEVALEHNLVHRVIELRLLEAQAYFVLDQKEKAWDALKPARGHAKNEGYLRLIDQGPVLVRLLKEAASQGIEPHFVHQLLKASNHEPDQPVLKQNLAGQNQPGVSQPAGQELVEPLSGREIEVLTLMAAGMSNADIAARLFLSTNTLKSHTQNIFGKLDVHSRVQAVNRARELGLI